MGKYANSAHERKISVYMEGDQEDNKYRPTDIYPNESIRKKVEEKAEDNMESLSKTVCRILRDYFRQNPNRKKSNIE